MKRTVAKAALVFALATQTSGFPRSAFAASTDLNNSVTPISPQVITIPLDQFVLSNSPSLDESPAYVYPAPDGGSDALLFYLTPSKDTVAPPDVPAPVFSNDAILATVPDTIQIGFESDSGQDNNLNNLYPYISTTLSTVEPGITLSCILVKDGYDSYVTIGNQPVTLTSHSPSVEYPMIRCQNNAGTSTTVRISCISFGGAPGCGFDLQANAMQLSQPGAVTNPNDGLLEVSPSTPDHPDPVEVTVPVSGTGFDSPETRTATVTLQGNFSPVPPQPINLSDIQANGTVPVKFEVNFDPSLSGTTQTITATVAPNNPFDESNFSNNTASVQVDVTGYKLKVTLPDTPVSDQQSLDPGILATMPMSDYGGKDCSTTNLVSRQRTILIQCLDANDKPVAGCTYNIDIQPGHDLGGHDPATHFGSRPLVRIDDALGIGASGDIPLEGIRVPVILPEVAGDNAINITGTDPNNDQLKADPLVFEMKVKNLIPITTIVSGLNVVVQSHPGFRNGYSDGSYASVGFAADVSQVVSEFRAKVLSETGVPARTIESQGVSLYWGGLFDINDNWHPDHCDHRDGRAMDISWKVMTPTERLAFAYVVKKSSTLKFYRKEAPGTSANHWHLMAK